MIQSLSLLHSTTTLMMSPHDMTPNKFSFTNISVDFLITELISSIITV